MATFRVWQHSDDEIEGLVLAEPGWVIRTEFYCDELGQQCMRVYTEPALKEMQE